MSATQKLIIRVLVRCLVAAIAFLALANWTMPDKGHLPDRPTYADRLTNGHDCWTAADGRTDLPNAAVATFRDRAEPLYVTNETRPDLVKISFDHALGDRTDKRVYAVHYLCID